MQETGEDWRFADLETGDLLRSWKNAGIVSYAAVSKAPSQIRCPCERWHMLGPT